MSSCIYDRVLLVPPANDSFGRRRDPNRYNPGPKEDKPKISIAWWLVPSVIVYMAASALVFA